MLGAILILSGCGKKTTIVPYNISLEIWGTLDSNDAFAAAIKEYSKINPNVGSIVYRKVSLDNYVGELVNAMAEGKGPDIFMLNNTWLPMLESKMEPMPPALKDINGFRNNFVDTVEADFVNNGEIYALPLSVDSLALYYNKDLFNNEGITAPPATWSEFDEDVKKLTKIDQSGKILQSGAAIGTSGNVNRFSDLLGMLMMQNKTEMVNANKRSTGMTNRGTKPDGQSTIPGADALAYYTQFSNPDSALYSWNNEMHYSLDAFSEGTLAMMFNYSWHMNTIRSKNAKINFNVAQVPQVYENSKVNYANYWGFGVARPIPQFRKADPKKPTGDNYARVIEAWQFLKYLTMGNSGSVSIHNAISKVSTNVPVTIDPAATYLQVTGRPAARRDLIEMQKNDPVLGPFAKGNLVAKSWYQKNPDAVEKIMSEMVDLITKNGMNVNEALNTGASRISDVLAR